MGLLSKTKKYLAKSNFKNEEITRLKKIRDITQMEADLLGEEIESFAETIQEYEDRITEIHNEKILKLNKVKEIEEKIEDVAWAEL